LQEEVIHATFPSLARREEQPVTAAERGKGVLLIQLGTPDAPTPQALRPYLRQFLSDRRVIDVPAWKWWFILHLFILRSRPAQSAAKYQRIWSPVTGSPLLHWTRRQAELLQKELPDVPVHFGMQIGNPPLAGAVTELISAGVERLIVLPLYPQYSATTTASAMDSLFKILMGRRRIPALRVVPPYYQHPAYIAAAAAVIGDELARLPWRPEHFLLSFHGIPKRYARAGDPYATHVKRTTAQLVAHLGWRRDQWTQTFQSLFGREVWLKPYTEEKLKELARRGIKRVFVAMPGFTADCLETLDEIGNEARESFRHAGGELLHACPCLNDHPQWIEALKTLVCEEGRGWF
jgi:protoporphyrin/coproporphyrin ferrochelatase